MKRTKIAIALFATLMSSSITYAADELSSQFVYKPFNTQNKTLLNVPEWVLARTERSPWGNVSGRYACSTWEVHPSQVNLDESFTQERKCLVDQERTVTGILYAKSIDRERPGETSIESQTITVDETQPAVGTRDYIIGETAKAWSYWSFSGSPKAHTAWSPAPESQTASFQQSRDYLQPETRTRNVVDDWKSGKETHNRVESENRDDRSTESRTVSVDFSNWTDTGALFDCSAWTPTPDTVNLGDTFEQTADCSRNQLRVRSYASGGSQLTSFNEARVIDETDRQQAVGSKDYINGSRNGDWSAWADVIVAHSHGSWLPAPAAQTADYQQSRAYKFDQERTRTVYDVWKSGKETANRTKTDEQTVNRSENRIVSVSFTAWIDKNGHYACTSWAPALNTIPYDQDVEQNRDCKQDQTRSRVYEASGSQLTSFVENKTITEQETQDAVGLLNFIDTTRNGSWSTWSNSGSAHSFGAYAPVANAQTTTFQQSRGYDQPQERTRTVYNVWADGSETVKTTETENRDLASTQNRNVTVSWSSWTNSGSQFDLGTWTPATNTVDSGTAFTQKQSYKQTQVRNRTYSESTVKQESKVVTGENSRSAVGTKNIIEGTSYGSWSAWTNNGSNHSFDTYAPAANAQTSTFSQSRGYKTPQERTRTVYNVWTDGSTTVKTTESETRDLAQTQTRSVTVAWSSWTNSGNQYDLGTWTPDRSTVNLGTAMTQKQSYKQNQVRNRTYSEGTVKQESKVVTGENSRSTTGTKNYIEGTSYGSWSFWSNNSSNHSFGTYAPAHGSQTANYTQSRGYKTPQQRTRTVYNDWADGSKTTKTTETQTRDLDQTQTRTITVSVSGWSNTTKSGYGSWSPVANAQTSTFSQSRGYTQSRTRTWTHKSGSKTVHTRGENGSYGTSESRNVTVSWSGWANSGGGYSYSSYSPSTSGTCMNKSLVQTRTYSQNQVRNRTYSEGTVKQESRVTTPSQSRTVSGSKDCITGTSYGSWSGWSNNGSAHSFGSWSPSASSQTSSFSQSRSYVQPQKRTRTVYNVWTSGATTVKTTDTDTRNLSLSQSRTVTISWGSWSNSGSAYNYSSYSPAASGTCVGSNVTQSRTYSQNQVRSRNYSEGTSKTESRTVSGSQSRSVAGTKNCITGQSTSYTSWVNGTTSYGTYSPSASTQTSSFTQKRSTSTPKSRDKITYNVYSNGSKVETGRVTETGATAGSQSRTVTVSAGSWYNSGSAHTYGSYSPAASTQTSSFTQTRSYKQPQAKKYTFSIGGSHYKYQTLNKSQSRSVTVSSTGWADAGSKSCSRWMHTGNVGNYKKLTRYCSISTKNTYSFSIGGSHSKHSKRSFIEVDFKYCGEIRCEDVR